MKLHERILTLILLFSLFPVASNAQQYKDLTCVAGNIKNGSGVPVKLVYKPVTFVDQPLTIERLTDSEGNFIMYFPLEHYSTIEIVFGTEGRGGLALFLNSRDSIFLAVNPADSINPVSFSGNGYEESYLRYMAFREFEKKHGNLLTEIPKISDFKAFEKAAKEWSKDLEKIHKQVLKELKADKELKERSDMFLNMKKGSWYLMYAHFQRNQNKVPYDSMPASFKEVIEEAKFLSYDMAYDPEYQNMITLHLSLVPQMKSDICGNYTGYLAYADSTYGPLSQEYLKARILIEGMDQGCFESIKGDVDRYLKETKDQNYVQVVAKKKEEMGTRLTGNPAPDFEFVDKEGNTHSLADLKGKVIYMDFWATWCGPCIRSMASAGPLKEKLKGNENIAFVYVSTDQNVEKWKSHYITNNGEKYHWHMGKNIMEASMAYQVRSIPRYVIINKEGIIVDENAPRPNDPSLADKLLELSK